MRHRPAGQVRCWQILKSVIQELAAGSAHDLVQQRFHHPQVSSEDRGPQFDRLLIVGRYGLGDLEAVVRERVRGVAYSRRHPGVGAAAGRLREHGDLRPFAGGQIGEDRRNA